MCLTTKQREEVEKLVSIFGENITLKELLEKKDNTPIEDVVFEITGVYVYAYECTGGKAHWKGTIKEILKELDSWKMFESPEAKISELITEDELLELSKFFLGEREDRCLDDVEVSISREVTLDEVKEYIGSLEVWSEFEYDSTTIEF